MRLSELFYVNKNDRIVLVWLIAVVACIVGVILLGNEKQNDEVVATDSAQEAIKNNPSNKGKPYYAYGERKAVPPRLHPFDLNTATPEEMLELGFNDREIRSVLSYRSKGGIYRKVEQLSRISGMTKGEYDRLAPYFRTNNDYLPASEFVNRPENDYYKHYDKRDFDKKDGRNAKAADKKGDEAAATDNGDEMAASLSDHPQKLKQGETIDINSSDTTELKKIPGVGSVYAKMIVKYREKLGGFYSVEQLNDLQALPSDIQTYLHLTPTPLRKMKVNALSINKLINHPYINFYQARDIVDHIRKNGPLKSIHELQLSKNFSEKDILRIEPYLEY